MPKKSAKKSAKKTAKPSHPADDSDTSSTSTALEVRTLAINGSLPVVGSVYAGETGTNITVRIETTGPDVADVTQVWAKFHVYGQNPTVPDTWAELEADPNLFTPLDNLGAGVWQKAMPIPVNCPCAGESMPGNNLSVQFAYRRSGQAAAFRGPKTSFKFICRTSYAVDVGAWACPWFAFITDPDYVGPEGEDMLTHRPVRVRKPVNASAVTITASGHWRHQARTIAGDLGGSGPEGNGREPLHPLYDARYRTESASNGHPQIQDPPSNLLVNTLVCVYEYNNPATASSIVPVGRGPLALNSAELANIKALHFGMWDGLQWNKGADEFSLSNSGTVTVTFNWTIT